MSVDRFDRSVDLLSSGLVEKHEPGSTLFEAGDPADGAYVILSGTCAVIEGDEQVNALDAGELFGEFAAFGDGRRTATVRAIEPTEVVHIRTDALKEAFASSPELFWHLLHTVVARTKQITEREVAYRDEHRALQEAQRSLLPDLTELPTDTGFSVEAIWEPCTYASGDLYDVVPIDADRYLFVIGDVMGHGAQSSLMMAIARAEINELVRSSRRTDELLLRLDGYLRDNAPPKQAMSVAIAAYNRTTRLLEYSCAGHPFPLLWRDGEVTTMDGRPGVLVGLPFQVGSGYERYEFVMEPGDRLLLMTDGLFEVVIDDQGAQLGTDGITALFGGVMADGDGAHPLESLFTEVAELDIADEPDDDRTGLLITIR